MAVSLNAPNKRIEYLHSLELAVPTDRLKAIGELASSVREADQTAYVDAGSTVSFVGGVALERQEDVLNSTLLAQLAANKKYDREIQTEQWYKFYREVLENVGWVVTNFGFQRYSESGVTLRLDKAALALISAIASGNELAVLTAAVKALENAQSESKAVTLFDANGSTGENGNFQIASCSEDPSGNVQSALGAFYFKASKHEGRFLFWSWETKSINFYFSTQSVVLNEKIYSTVRQTVIAKLGDNAKRFIAGLDI